MTKYNPNIHHRRSIRLQGYDYSQAGLYFITICVKNGEWLFGEVVDGKMVLNEYGEIAEKCWLEIPQHYPDVVLREFVVMPNHLHGIIEITTPATTTDVCVQTVGAQNFVPLPPRRNEFQKIIPRSIGAIIRGFKIGTTKQLGYSVWQRNYYENIICDYSAHAKIIEYIQYNPARWETDRFYNE